MILMIARLEALGAQHAGVIRRARLAVVCALATFKDVTAGCALGSGGVLRALFCALRDFQRPWF